MMFGALRDEPDERDILYDAPATASVPLAVDLRPDLPPCWWQGDVGSCTAQAAAALFQFLFPDYHPSRMAIYWQSRYLEHSISRDAGSMPRNALKVLTKYGVVSEDQWPYDDYRVLMQPPLLEGPVKLARYARMLNETAMLHCLASKTPFILSISLPENFTSAAVWETGIVPEGESPTTQRHAMLAVGYDLSRSMLLLRNSWGVSWGDNGHCWLPISYVSATGRERTDADAWYAHKLVAQADETGGPKVVGVPIKGEHV